MGLKKSASLGNWYDNPQDLNENLVLFLPFLELIKSNLTVLSLVMVFVAGIMISFLFSLLRNAPESKSRFSNWK